MSIDIENKIITVAAAIIMNQDHQFLVVRKKNTEFYMQVGGKIEPNELPSACLLREIKEEILVNAQITEDLGCVITQAANEPEYKLKAYLFKVDILGTAQASSEIEDIQWIDLHNYQNFPLAPLTREIVLPLLKNL